MRRIYRATTALVASLSLVSPGLVTAQETPSDPGSEVMVPQPAAPQGAIAAPEDGATGAPEAQTSDNAPEAVREVPEEAAQDLSPSDEPPASTSQSGPAEMEGTPAQSEPEPPMAAEAPAATDIPENDASPALRMEQPDPGALPESRPPEDPAPPMEPGPADDDIPADETAAPDGEAARTDGGSAEMPSPDIGTSPETPVESIGAEAAGELSAASEPPEADDTSAGDDTDALRRALEERALEDETGVPREPAIEAEPPPLDDGANPAAETPPETSDATDGTQDAESSAPESGAVETDAARAEATPAPVEGNDALRALETLLGGETPAAAEGQLSEFTVGEEGARSSDEDFATSVMRSISGDSAREDGVEEAREDDNRGRDLARFALAGLAGLAVGKMLSDNREVELNTGDRVVVSLPDGSQQVIKDEDALLFRPGSNIQTERYDDGSTITTVLREDGSKVVTIRDANMRILRRSVVQSDGSSAMLIDDTVEVEPVVISELPPPARPIEYSERMDETALRAALMQEAAIDRRFTLGQIRNIAQVRALVAPLDIQSVTFETGSAAITPDQARQLSALGRAVAETIAQNPRELFLIEGYTDAVGSEASNLALSDRRAESVALALTEYFEVPPENLVVQGYGEQFLRIQTQEADRLNRRVAVRRITDLVAQN